MDSWWVQRLGNGLRSGSRVFVGWRCQAEHMCRERGPTHIRDAMILNFEMKFAR